MLQLEEEKELVAQILSGNKERYAVIVDEYQQIVANLCYSLVGNSVDVDEVVQRVFVDLYEALPRFQFKSRLSTFVYRMTVNVVAKEMKHRGRYTTLEEGVAERQGSEPSSEEKRINEERLAKLREAIGRLKPEQRTALVLYTYDNLSYNDIAEVIGASLSKVESLIFRAKKNLKEMLTGQTTKND